MPPPSEPKLIRPSEVLQTIRGIKIGKASGPDGIPNRVLRHVPKRRQAILGTSMETTLAYPN